MEQTNETQPTPSTNNHLKQVMAMMIVALIAAIALGVLLFYARGDVDEAKLALQTQDQQIDTLQETNQTLTSDLAAANEEESTNTSAVADTNFAGAVSYSGENLQLIVPNSTRQQDINSDVQIDTLVHQDFFLNLEGEKTSYTQWSQDPATIDANQTSSTSLSELGFDNGGEIYIGIDSNRIAKSELSNAKAYYYRTVVKAGNDLYYGPIGTFQTLK